MGSLLKVGSLLLSGAAVVKAGYASAHTYIITWPKTIGTPDGLFIGYVSAMYRLCIGYLSARLAGDFESV